MFIFIDNTEILNMCRALKYTIEADNYKREAVKINQLINALIKLD